MKETIYTIPVTDAFNTPCECPICILEKNLENKIIESTLGASMMEPDARIESNKKGYCKNHFEILSKQNNTLSLALILDTHLKETNDLLCSLFERIQLNEKRTSKSLTSLFMKKHSPSGVSSQHLNDVVNFLETFDKKCVVCDKINYTMNKYMDVMFYMWRKDKDFQDSFTKTSGFCLKHFKGLLINAEKFLKSKELSDFLDTIVTLEMKNLKRIQDEVNWFTKKFDYQNKDASWKNSKDAVPRSIEKLAGYTRD